MKVESATSQKIGQKNKYDSVLAKLILLLLLLAPVTRAGVNVLSFLIFLVWVAKKVFYQDEDVKFSDLKKWLLIYGVMISLSLINAVDLQYGIRTFVSKYLKYVIVFLATVEVVKTEEQIKKMWKTLPFSALIAFGYAIYEYFVLDISRITGTYNNANPAGTGLMMITLLCISFTLFSKKKFYKILGGIYSLLGLISLMATYSRGAWLGFILGIIIILGCLLKEHELLNMRTVVISLIVLIIIGTFFVPENITSRFQTITDLSSSSNSHRLKQYNIAIEMFKNHPLVGIGIGQFRPIFPDYLELFNYNIHEVSKIHNVYLNTLAENGLLGIIGLIVLFYKFFRVIILKWKKNNIWFQYGMIGIFVAVATHSMFDHTFFQTQVGVYLLILTGIWSNNIFLKED
ncbi:O-antigen ligase family protein [Natroniella sp. ANB-PHB2]|uniref:O-antigen ligase family protein n=1 Tax=Natroniella sp. ANB-PHB2 TaxID=3384444 RepID=UPI0038D4FFE6